MNSAAPDSLAAPPHEEVSPPPRTRLRLPLIFGLVAVVALVLVPVITVIILGIGTARKNTFELLRSEVSGFMSVVEQRIHRHLDPIVAQSDYLAQEIGTGAVDPADHGLLAAHLSGALAALPQVRELSFLDLDHRILRVNRRTKRPTFKDWSDDPETRRVLAEARSRQGPYWGDFFFAESTQTTLLNLRTPVWRDGEFLGVLISVVSIVDLSEFLAQTPVDYIKRAFILVGSDQVLAHPRLVRGFEGLSDEQPLPHIDQIGDPVLEAMMSGAPEGTRPSRRLQERVGGRTIRVGDDSYVVVIREIRGYGREPWRAGFYLPLEHIEDAFARIRVIGGMGGGILFLAVGAAVILGRSLTRPIRRLSAAIGAEAGGNAGARPPREFSLFSELDDAASGLAAMQGHSAALKSYLSEKLVGRIMQQTDTAHLKSERREVTVLFTDIGGFTNLAAHMPADEVAAFLNEHFSMLAECIKAEGGTVDKYMGDSLMAFWGAPDNDPDHATRAFNATLTIGAKMRAFNAQRRATGLEPILLRMGLHSGVAIVGNIGAAGHVNYTVIGDTVNTAARIENLSKEFLEDSHEVITLVSSATNEALGGGLESFSVGSHTLRGRIGLGDIEVYRLT